MTVKEALELDKENGDNLWGESLATEVGQINDHETFRIIEIGILLVEYQRIPYNFMFNVKFDR